MFAGLSKMKHLSAAEFDAELGRTIRAATAKQRQAYPVAKPKKKTTKKK